ncbi:hypothetical protein Bca101_029725 [Brassica carinata]
MENLMARRAASMLAGALQNQYQNSAIATANNINFKAQLEQADQDQTQAHTKPEQIIPPGTRKKRGRPSGKTSTAGRTTSLSGTGSKKRKEDYPSEPEQSTPGPETTGTNAYYSNNRRRI